MGSKNIRIIRNRVNYGSIHVSYFLMGNKFSNQLLNAKSWVNVTNTRYAVSLERKAN